MPDKGTLGVLYPMLAKYLEGIADLALLNMGSHAFLMSLCCVLLHHIAEHLLVPHCPIPVIAHIERLRME